MAISNNNGGNEEDKVPSSNRGNIQPIILPEDMMKPLGTRINPLPTGIFGGNAPDKPTRFDEDVTPYNAHNIRSIRADNQQAYEKALNSVVGGLGSGLLTAAEDLSYMTLQPLGRAFGVLDKWEDNFLADLAKQGKESISEAMPLHTRSDLSFWHGLKGVIDSGVGFALPGAMAGKGIATIQKLPRAIQATTRNARLAQLMQMMRTGTPGQLDNVAHLLGTGFLTNHAEGTMMGMEVYENVLDALIQDNPGADANQMIDFEQRAAAAADRFRNLNRLMIVSDAFAVKGLYDGAALTRNLLKDPRRRFTEAAKDLLVANENNLIKQGLAEGVEEIAQGVGQSEVEYQAIRDAGVNVDDFEVDQLKRLLDFATSKETLFEGAMGFFGGGVQRLITESASAALGGNSRQDRINAYEAQQEMFLRNEEYAKQVSKDIDKLAGLMREAEELQQDVVKDHLQNSYFAQLAKDNFRRGTTENLQNHLQDVIDNKELSKEERDKAQEHLDMLFSMEKDWRRYSKFERNEEIWENRQAKKIWAKFQEKTNRNVEEARSLAQKELDRMINYISPEKRVVAEKQADGVIREVPIVVSVDELYKGNQNKINPRNIAIFNSIYGHAKKSEEYQAFRKAMTIDEKAQDYLNTLDEQYAELTDPLNQGQFMRERAAKEAIAREVAQDIKKKERVAKAKEKRKEEKKEESKKKEEAKKKAQQTPVNMDDVVADIAKKMNEGKALSEEEELLAEAEKAKLEKALKKEQESPTPTSNITAEDFINDDMARTLVMEAVQGGANVQQAITRMLADEDLAEKWSRTSTEEKDKLRADIEKLIQAVQQKEKADRQSDDKDEKEADSQLDQPTDEKIDDARKEQNRILSELEKAFNQTEESSRGAKIAMSAIPGVTTKRYSLDDLREAVNKKAAPLHDPKFVKKGDVVSVRVVTDLDQPMVYKGEEMTFGTFKSLVDNDSETFKRHAPVGIYKGDILLGFLHDPNKLNPSEAGLNLAIRNAVSEAGTINLKIADRKSGVVPRLSAPTQMAQAMPTAPIVTLVSKPYRASQEVRIVSQSPNYKKIPEFRDSGYIHRKKGMSFAVVNVNGRDLPMPMSPLRLGRGNADRRYVKTLREAVRIYIEEDQDSVLYKWVKNNLNLDLVVADDLESFLDRYIAVRKPFYEFDAGEEISVKEQVEGARQERKESQKAQELDPESSPHEFINTDGLSDSTGIIGMEHKAIKFAQGGGEVYTISRKTPADRLPGFYDNLERALQKVYMHATNPAKLSSEDRQSFKLPLLTGDNFDRVIDINEGESYENFLRKIHEVDVAQVNFGTEEEPQYVDTINDQVYLELPTEEVLVPEQLEGETLEDKKKKVTPLDKRELDEQATDEFYRRLSIQQKEKENLQKDPFYDPYRDLRSSSRNTKKMGGVFYSVGYVDEDFSPNVYVRRFKNGILQKEDIYDNYNKATKNARENALNDKEFQQGILDHFDNEKRILEDYYKKLYGSIPKDVKPSPPIEDVADDLLSQDDGTIVIDPDELADPDFDEEEFYFPSSAQREDITDLTLLVPGITSWEQKEFVETLSGIILRNALDSDDNRIQLKDVADQMKAKLRAQDKSVKATQLLKHFNIVEELVSKRLSEIQFGKIKGLNEEISEANDEIEDTEETTRERNLWEDGAVFTVNPKSTAGQQFKSWLASRYWKQYSPKHKQMVSIQSKFLAEVTGDPNFKRHVPFDIAFNTLSELLSNGPKTPEGMIETIKQNAHIRPWMLGLAEDLSQLTDGQIINQFYVAMDKHKSIMESVLWKVEESNKTFQYVFSIINENANSITQTNRRKWQSELAANEKLFSISPKGEIYINKDSLDKIKESIQTLVDSKEIITYDEMKNVYKEFGILLPKAAFNAARVKKAGHPISEGGLRILVNRLQNLRASLEEYTRVNEKNEPERPFDVGNFFTGPAINQLAEWIGSFKDESYSNSYRVADKTIYAYRVNNLVFDELNNLKDPAKAIEHIEDDFSKHSRILRELYLARGDEREFVKSGGSYVRTGANVGESIDVSYLSIQAFKGNVRSKTNKEIINLTNTEHEMTKIAMFQNSALTGARFFVPTMSDKSTMMVFKTKRYDLLKGSDFIMSEGVIGEKAVEELFYTAVLPEIDRIRRIQENDNYYNIQGYNRGGQQFYFIPELNRIPELWDNDVFIDTPSTREIIKGYLKTYIKNQAAKQIEEWKELGIIHPDNLFKSAFDSAYMTHYEEKLTSTKNVNHLLQAVASDYVYNYALFNASYYQTFVGDPSFYFKKAKGEFSNEADKRMANASETMVNVGKRLAAQMAPGSSLAPNPERPTYNMLVVADAVFKSLSKDYYTKIGLSNKAYTEINSADAQELTTLEEHIDVQYQYGKIPEEMYRRIKDKIQRGEDTTAEEEAIILAPVKPVYTGFSMRDGIRTPLYVKSSSVPLIPRLTRGTDLDKVRKMMEESNIHRLAYESSVKVGGVVNPIVLWDRDTRRVNDNSLQQISNAMKTGVHPAVISNISRSGFRIQQEIPLGKIGVNIGTQERKLLFNDINIIPEVAAIQANYNKTWDDLFSIKQASFYEEFTKNGKLDVARIKKALVKEAQERNYPLSDILAIDLDENGNFKLPLWTLHSRKKIEALLMSLVDNKIRKHKNPGKSYVLLSETGFIFDDKLKSGITFTDKFDTSLKSQGAYKDENGNPKLGPTQVFIPFPKAWKEAGIKLSDLKNEEGIIDTSKIDERILKLFGFRIPTQGLNSMANIEIAGFLPEGYEDVIIASQDFVEQMGSDFDIDKLYTYQHNLIKDSQGKVRVLDETVSFAEYTELMGDSRTSFNDYQQNILEAKLLDFHHQVLSIDHPFVQNRIAQPLDQPLISAIANKYNTDPIITEPLMPSYQRQKLINATAGKAGIGVFSLASVFNASIQGKGLRLERSTFQGDDVIYTPELFTIGKGNTSEGDLSNMWTIRSQKIIDSAVKEEERKQNAPLTTDQVNDIAMGLLMQGKVRTKSEVISAYQSASVDNEKLQILDKLFVNNETFSVVQALAQLGFEEEEITLVIKQPIVMDYVKKLNTLKSETNSLSIADQQKAALDYIKAKYPGNEDKDSQIPFYSIKFSELKDMVLTENIEAIDKYNEKQLAAFAFFTKVSKLGRRLQSIQNAINTDSGGVGKSVLTAKTKQEDVSVKLKKNSSGIPFVSIVNLEELTQYDPSNVEKNSINAMAGHYALRTALNVWSPIMPYNAGLSRGFAYIEEIIQQDIDASLDSRVRQREDIFEHFMSYIYNSNKYGIGVNHKEFVGSGNVLEQINQYKVSEEGKRNLFLQRLQIFPSKNKSIPYNVYMNASLAEQSDDINLYTAFNELMQNKPEFGKALIRYAFAFGGHQGAREYLKYVHPVHYDDIGLTDKLKDLENFNIDLSGIMFPINETEEGDFIGPPPFVIQYIQHNPFRMPSWNNEWTKGKPGKSALRAKVKSDGNVIELPPPFFQATLDDNKRALYMLTQDKEGFIYQRIPILGRKGKREYNPTYLGAAPSILNDEGLSKQIEPKVERPVAPSPVVKKELPQKKADISGEEVSYNSYLKKSGKEALEDIVMNPQASSATTAMAEMLLNFAKENNIDLSKIKFVRRDSSYTAVSYDTRTGEALSSPEISIVKDLENEASIANIPVETYAAEVVTHELTHYVFSSALVVANKNKNISKKAKAKYDELKNIYHIGLEKLKLAIDDDNDLENIVDYIESSENQSSDKGLHEFIAFLSNADVRKALNQEVYDFEKNKSIFDMIKDLIGEILDALGLSIQSPLHQITVDKIVELGRDYYRTKYTEEGPQQLSLDLVGDPELEEDTKSTPPPPTYDDTLKKKRLNKNNKEKSPGAVVKYNGQYYILWKINSSGKAQLTGPNGEKFSGTPNLDKLEVLGHFPQVTYNNSPYVVTDKDNIFSLATGKLVYTGGPQREQILNLVNNPTLPNQLDINDLGDPDFDSFEYMTFGYNPFVNNRDFPELTDSIQIQLREMKSRINANRTLAKTTKDAKLRASLLIENQMLQKTLETYEDQLKSSYTLTEIKDLGRFAEAHFKEVERVLRKSFISAADLNYVNQVLKVWQAAGQEEFEMGQSHIWLTDDELKDPKIMNGDGTASWPGLRYYANRAAELKREVSKIEEKVVTDTVNKFLNTKLSGEVIFKALQDLNIIAANVMDISRMNDPMLQAIFTGVKNKSIAANLEYDRITKQYEELLELALPELRSRNYKNPFDLFYQVDKKGNRTGSLVYPFSQEFFDTDQDLKNIKGKADWNKENKIVIDPRAFDFDDVPYSGPKLSKKEKEAHIEEVKKQLHPKTYANYVKHLRKKIELYKNMYEAQKTILDNNPSLDAKQREESLRFWELRNSPFYFAVSKAGEKLKMGNITVSNVGFQYTYEIPRRFEKTSGKETGWYDPKYDEIADNENLYNLHHFILETFQTMQEYLPPHITSEMQINSLPMLFSGLMEESAQGMHRIAAIGMRRTVDSMKEILRAEEDAEIVYQPRDPITGQQPRKVNAPNPMVHKKRAYRELKIWVREQIAETGKTPTQQQKREKHREILDRLLRSAEYTDDLSVIFKKFIDSTVAYKHKASIEDEIRLLERAFNGRPENKFTVQNEAVKDKWGKAINSLSDGKNYKDMLEYSLRRFYNLPETEKEGLQKKKLLTDREKKERELLVASREKVVNSTDINANTKKTLLKEIDQDIENLGQNVAVSGMVDLVQRYVQLKGMGWNFYSSISNLGFGLIGNMVEAADGRMFTEGDFFWGLKVAKGAILRNATFNQVSDKQAIKLRKLMDKMNILKTQQNEIYKAYDKHSIESKARFLHPYNLQERTEYLNQAPVLAAMMKNQKIKDKSGKEYSLWEAYDDEGNFKTEQFGDEFTRMREIGSEETKFIAKVDQVIKKIHGNYDPNSPKMLKKTALGRLAMQFRSWLFEGFATRWEGEKFDYTLGVERKGRYRSLFDALTEKGGIGITGKMILRKATFGTAFKNARFEEVLSDVDAANMRANLQEAFIYLSLLGVAWMLKASIDDDDNGLAIFMLNQIHRLQSDIILYAWPGEWVKTVMNDPIPASRLFTDFDKLRSASMGLLYGNDIIETGPYAGQSRFGRAGVKFIPLVNQVPRTINSAQTVFEDRQ